MSTLMIMAGGTGGHVFPALSVARELRSRGVDIVWLGTRQGLEARAVPEAGFDIEWIRIRGLRGKGLWGWIRLPFLMTAAMFQTASVVFRRRPAAVLGMGGFVSGPGALVALLLRIPLLIHEANALSGLTNRCLAWFADRVMTGFPVPLGRRSVHTGNPVRSEIAAIEGPETRLAHRSGALRILVIGGSQGALALNRSLPGIFAQTKVPLEIRHQAGRGRAEAVADRYRELSLPAEVSEFIDDMARAYQWSDLVVCRSGAMTVAEICAAGASALFIPFPYAVGDHQTVNAGFLVDNEAAWLLPERDIETEHPVTFIRDLSRAQIQERASRARLLARPDSANQVTEICLEVLRA